jgi:DNA-binding transcriptional LysR family regulator
MDFRHLRTFVTVADLGTVSKAAAELGVAQPALSRQIKDLETDLGVTLFDRVRRRLILTSDGQVLLSECRNALGTLGSIRDRAQLLRSPDSGVLRVAATPQTIDGVLSVFLARYAKHRPNVQIRLNEAFGAELLALLERGEAHVVITTGGALEASSGQFDITWLPPLEFVAVCNPSANIGSGQSMDVRELGSHPVLLLRRSFAVRGAFDAACRVAEFKPNVSFESATPHTLLALAEAGQGIAIVPSVLPTHRYNVRVTRLEYRKKPLRETYAIVRNPRRSVPRAADEFCRSLSAHVREVFPISRPSGPAPARKNKRKKANRTG